MTGLELKGCFSPTCTLGLELYLEIEHAIVTIDSYFGKNTIVNGHHSQFKGQCSNNGIEWLIEVLANVSFHHK